MKKILLILLLLFCINFNIYSENTDDFDSNIFNCEYFKGDEYLNNLQAKLKKENEYNKIMCDFDKDKMAYYVIGDSGLSVIIGVAVYVDVTTTINDSMEIIKENIDKYSKIFKESRKKTRRKNYKLPDNEIVSLYAIIKPDNKIFFLSNIEIKTDTDKLTVYINNEIDTLFEYFKEKNPDIDVQKGSI